MDSRQVNEEALIFERAADFLRTSHTQSLTQFLTDTDRAFKKKNQQALRLPAIVKYHAIPQTKPSGNANSKLPLKKQLALQRKKVGQILEDDEALAETLAKLPITLKSWTSGACERNNLKQSELNFAETFIKKFMKQTSERKVSMAPSTVNRAAIARRNTIKLIEIRRNTVTDLGSSPKQRHFNLNLIICSEIVAILQTSISERSESEKNTLFDYLRGMKAFKDTTDTVLAELCLSFRVSSLPENSTVFKQGDIGKEWYIILAGSCNVLISKSGYIKDAVQVAVLPTGAGFGDLALINDKPRLASIVTATNCTLIYVERLEYSRILDNFLHPDLIAVLETSCYQRTKEETKMLFDYVRQLKAFKDISNFILGELCAVFKFIRMKTDVSVFRQGDIGKEWYIILAGSCRVLISKTGTSKTGLVEDCIQVATLFKGTGFGDLALMNDKPRLASIVTATQCQLISVERNDYNRIMKVFTRAEQTEKLTFLKKIFIFDSYEIYEIKPVADFLKWQSFKPGETIIEKGTRRLTLGQSINNLYFIRKGQCDRFDTFMPPGKTKAVHVKIDSISEYDMFGEEATIANFNDVVLNVPSRYTVKVSKTCLELKIGIISTHHSSQLYDSVKTHVFPDQLTSALAYEKYLTHREDLKNRKFVLGAWLKDAEIEERVKGKLWRL